MYAQNFEETQNTKAVTNPTLSQDSNMENSKPEEVLKKKLAVLLESLDTAQKIKVNTLKTLLVESHETISLLSQKNEKQLEMFEAEKEKFEKEMVKTLDNFGQLKTKIEEFEAKSIQAKLEKEQGNLEVLHEVNQKMINPLYLFGPYIISLDP